MLVYVQGASRRGKPANVAVELGNTLRKHEILGLRSKEKKGTFSLSLTHSLTHSFNST